MVHRRLPELTPADRVTAVRAALVLVVAVLTLQASRSGATDSWLLASVAAVALVLDGVDGWVARRTGSVSADGARFDMEVDAALILVLSLYVARDVGVWVLAIGLARYVFALLAWALPWLKAPVPAMYWRKVVAAVQGITLTVVAAGVLPATWAEAALGAALLLLVVSFTTQAWWLWRHRSAGTAAHWSVTVAAALLVWVALVLPDDLTRLTPAAFVRLPVEALLVLAVVVLLPARARTAASVVLGALLGVLTVMTLLDLGFSEALGRPFDPVADWGYADAAFGLLSDSVGRTRAFVVGLVVVAAVVAVLAVVPLALLRLTRAAHGRRRWSARLLAAAAAVWVGCAVLGVQVVPGTPVAAANTVDVTRDQVATVRAGLADRREFGAALAADAFRDRPASQLLTRLRGKDVLVVFVESYGRVALEGSHSAGVDAVLDAGTRSLSAAGFGARSAYLTSPTFGGISWLAHSTLQSGLWVDSQERYDTLLSGERFTLSAAFHQAGWRTVDVVPSNTEDWPEGRAFYGYDAIYGAGDLGYAGPSFSYATMPDQYVLAALQRLELAAPERLPVMAEVDLVSSHTPWAPLPRMVPWTSVGDGSVFDAMPAEGRAPASVWRDPEQVRAAYAQSVEYTLSALISFVRTYGDDDLVLVVLGDHQPATVVSGRGASHDVPVTVVAHDPQVLARTAAWGWTTGLRPAADAPVWRMDAFRDRFLNAFGPPAS